MAIHEATLDADGDVFLCNVRKPRGADYYMATVHVVSTDFGGGTVTIGTSVDGGTTIVPTTFVTTENKADNIDKLGSSGKNTENIQLYASLSGAAAPDTVTITVHDNV